MEKSHIGIIVLFLYPIPNSRMLLSILYKNLGFIIGTNENMTIKIIMDTKVLLFLIN
jgi:hypothetical protein